MPLNKAQLMEVPGGPGVTGSVKAGSGVSISADGTVSVNAATNITQIVAGTNVSISPTSGVGVVTINAAGGGGGGEFPAGTTIVFYQASAPPGWTQVTNFDNAALRMVGGPGGGTTGGTTDFTTAFGSYTPGGSVSVSLSGLSLSGASTNTVNQTPSGSVSLGGLSVGSTSIATSQMPSHSHQYQQRPPGGPGVVGQGNIGNNNTVATTGEGGSGGHNHSISGSGSFSGNNMSHDHNVSGSVSGNASASFTGSATTQFAVKYVNVILCTKN